MPIKPFQAKLFAYELARQLPSNNIGKFTASLQDAQVDLNPHQVDAAMFAFKSPLSNGALLADEVGLGKTIEAGIILSQKWAERKRKLLIIGPANLRKQWNQELQDKFFLPSVILEAKSFNANVDNGNFNPFSQKDAIVICSFQFAKAKAAYLKKTDWDLVVIDEAHRLRNVYKPTNQIGNAIKNALNGKKKILLTATPLQNTLQELYGLVSIIDDYYFGDLKSFNAQYAKQLNEVNFGELRNRLLPVCHRTLRKQVREYIKYTDRIAIRQEFYPTEEEQKLYDDVSEFLRRPQLYSMPNSQRLLMTLIARKLLASSTFAINGTLQSMIKRLEALVVENDTNLKAELIDDYEGADNFQEEKGANENDETPDDEDENELSSQLTEEDIAAIKEEIADLKGYQQLAFRIKVNSKANHLLIALESGFKQLESDKKTADGQRAARKALIFTESKRTQQFLYELLEESGYKDKIVLFNGSNNDAKSNAIYKAWLKKHKGSDKITGSATADKRAALVEYFKHEAVIMIATEAAAEGINLQFCSLIVNYDMPWNPQRIEQRIGRCHRYGQNFDVVVVNFLNMANAADQHVYNLLEQKFKLFDSVFGASDEVLGTIGNGLDFEKRISQIYDECRTNDEINTAFAKLNEEFKDDIDKSMKEARTKLIENMDDEVREKLRFSQEGSITNLRRYEKLLWDITQFALSGVADFDSKQHKFKLKHNLYSNPEIHTGHYQFICADENGKRTQIALDDNAIIYRAGHPLALQVVEACKKNQIDSHKISFNYSESASKITPLESFVGQSGWISVENLKIESFETEDYLLYACFTDNGQQLDAELTARLLSLPATEHNAVVPSESVVARCNELIQVATNAFVSENIDRNKQFFLDETNKLNVWADDQVEAKTLELKQTKAELKDKERQSRKATSPEELLSLQKLIRTLESKQSKLRREMFMIEDEIRAKRDKMIDDIETRMKQKVTSEKLFTLRWEII